MPAGRTATRTARRVGDHPVVETLARLGYAASGVLHLLIAWAGIMLALGRPGGTTDQSGALGELAGTTLGRLVLVVAAVGFAGLTVWEVAEVVLAREAGDRVKAGAKGVVYLVLAVSCASFLRGSGTSSSGQSTDLTARLMGAPLGRVLVGLVGLGVVAVGVYHVVKGVRRRFLADLAGRPGPLAVLAGQVGYAVKGVALVVVGILFVAAAVTEDPDRARGLDGAFHALLAQPFGVALTLLVSLGFLAYGVYSFFRARYADV